MENLSYGFWILAVLMVVFMAALWISRPKLLQEEKSFVKYAQEEARKQGVKEDGIHRFVFENEQKLRMLYAGRVGSLSIRDLPRVLETIEKTYVSA